MRRCCRKFTALSARAENFYSRIENAQIREGGFSMIHGDPSSGESVPLRLLAQRLSRVSDLNVAAIHHPQCNLADFNLEMDDIFGVSLRPHNR